MSLVKKSLLVAITVLFSQNVSADGARKGELIWRGTYLSAARVEGSWGEMGAEAAQLSNLAPQNSEPYSLNEMINKQINDSFNFPPLAWAAGLYLDLTIFNPLKSHMLPEDKEMIDAISQSSNIPIGVLEKAFVIPDAVGPLLLLKTKPTRKLAAIQECSSFVAYGDRTITGERIFGRNLDYPSIGTLDMATTVYLLRPDSGYQILSVAPEGFPVASVSAMNEKGLVLALHNAFSMNISKSGTPIFSVNREVMEHAATIEEAIKIYQKYQYQSGWMIHMSDRDPVTRKPRGVIIELSGIGVTYKNDQGSFSALTNSYQTKEQQDQELYISVGSAFHNRDRLQRLNALVTAKPLTSEDAISLLSDSYSPSAKSEVQYSHSGIRAVDQVNSMVFLPDQGKILVAEGVAPASFGAFYEFSFDQMNQGLVPRKVRDPISTPESVQEVAQAFKSEFQEENHYDSYRHLILANQLSKDCSFSLIGGGASLHQGDYSAAEALLTTAMNCANYNPHQKATAMLLHGLLQWNFGDFDLAGNEISVARHLEQNLGKSTGVFGNSDFLRLADSLLSRIQRGEQPDSKWISDKSKLDIKTGDNLGGWE